jgi:NHL repeat-containing protein
MALEPRLRQALRTASAALPEPPTERLIEAVVHHGHRRRLVRQVRTALILLAVLSAAVAATPRIVRELSSWRDTSPATPAPAAPAIITTIAGNGTLGPHDEGVDAAGASVEYPVDLDFDAYGNLYILEHEYPQRVTRVDPLGTITTVLGPGAAGEAGRVELARTFGATGLAVDTEGNVYVGGGAGGFAENRVIRVDPSGKVLTVAGTGEAGSSGDGGPATDAEIQDIWDLAIDARGNLYIAGHSRIRKVDADGIITTLVGGAERGFSGDGGPAADALVERVTGVAVDSLGNVFFIDYGNDRIRHIDTNGIITTIAGAGHGKDCSDDADAIGDGGPALEANFCGAEHLDVDGLGDVYIADTYNDRIRMIDTRGTVTTIAGTGIQGFSGDGDLASDAQLSEPSGVAVGPDGALYIADSGSNRVRRVAL